MIERFVREARVMSELRHPCVVDVYGFGMTEDGTLYYVMELLRGTDLEERLRSRGRHSPAEALAILAPVCAALEAAHAAGIVHRDVKAGNIFVGDRGVKLLDFGIAKLAERPAGFASLTSRALKLGTPSAMAPEQIRGQAVDRRTDIYGLGILLFQLVTGRLPFGAEDAYELETLHLHAPPPLASRFAAVPPAVDHVIFKALRKLAPHRQTSAAQFRDELTGAVGRPASEVSCGRNVAVQVVVFPAGQDDGSDGMLDAIAAAVAVARASCLEHGLVVTFEGGNSLIASRPLPEEPAARRLVQQNMVALARRLHARISSDTVGPQVSMHASTCVVAAAATPSPRRQHPAGSLARLGASSRWPDECNPPRHAEHEPDGLSPRSVPLR
jgi:serine/threonine-protein kinase